MKIVIVGTSNSLVRGGWYDGFQYAVGGTHDVERIALGGAPFTQFLSLLTSIQHRMPEHIVVECAANDESYAAQVGNDIFFDRLYYMFLSSLRSCAAVTVLRLPPQATVAVGSPIARRQATICRQLDCTYYDAAPEILDLGKTTEAPFRDKHHPATEIAHQIGKSFGKYLMDQLSNQQRSAPLQNFANSVKEIEIDFENHPLTKIETTLVSEQFAILKPGTMIDLPDPEFILGFFVNSGETRGVIRLDGSVDRRDVFCYFMSQSNKNVKRYIPVFNGVHARRLSSLFAHQAINIALHTDLFHIPQQIALGKVIAINMNQSA